MQDQIAQQFQKIEQFFDARLFVNIDAWSQSAKIGTELRGVYVIYDKTHIYYVGKGQIKARQKMHKEKFEGSFKHAKDTLGFRALREAELDIDLDQLKIMWVGIAQETLIGAVESALIHLLQPMANDEVVKDKQKAV